MQKSSVFTATRPPPLQNPPVIDPGVVFKKFQNNVFKCGKRVFLDQNGGKKRVVFFRLNLAPKKMYKKYRCRPCLTFSDRFP